MPSSWFRTICFVLLTFLGGNVLQAQTASEDLRPKENSPYSRMGLGNYFSQYLASTAAMGGLSAAYHDPFHLNLLNPASLPHLRATAFEIGMYAKYSQLESSEQSDNLWGGNIGYIALGFPLKNRVNEALDRSQSPWDFGMNLALMPYTQVGYDVTIQDRQDDGYKLATNRLKGDGGTYRLQWGNGVQYKGLSLGATLNYNFGKLINNRRVDFDSLAHSFSTEFLDEMSVSGVTWNFGAMYTHSFKEKNSDGMMVANGKRLIFGAYGHSAQDINTNSSNLYVRSNVSSFVTTAVIDTISYLTDQERKMTLPTEFTFGIAYEEYTKLRLGLEYSIGQWSQYNNPSKPESLTNNSRLSFGIEYVPDATSYNSYTKKMFYRGGFFTGTDPRSAGGEQIKHTGITLGLGFPIIMPRQQISFFDLSLELGQFGVKDVLQEKYAKLTLGFTLNDNSWFFKRKFN
jgi:hypothetical protein